tara:strand:- start:19 stop:237 length:219 start_codon:yes stop_codon:yes gene_type:complete
MILLNRKTNTHQEVDAALAKAACIWEYPPSAQPANNAKAPDDCDIRSWDSENTDSLSFPKASYLSAADTVQP